MDNTLFLGNGINLNLFDKAPKWSDIYEKDKTFDIRNYTFLYEACLLNAKKSDDDFKQHIVDRLKAEISIDKIKPSVNNLDKIGELLESHGVSDLITTNVDTCLESLLLEYNGFYTEDSTWSTETVYSIRRKKQFHRSDYNLNIWKIHGDDDHVKTVTFGYDQYCGSLAKIDEYIKGKYTGKDVNNKIHMTEKCKFNDLYDGYSWIELFFKTNVYIACFGMDFSEIDIWWILNKRIRFKNAHVPIDNKIVFLYSKYDYGEGEKTKEEKEAKKLEFIEKKNMLRTFGVECKEIETGDSIISSIFEKIT